MLGDIDEDDEPLVLLAFNAIIIGEADADNIPAALRALFELLEDQTSLLDIDRQNLGAGAQFIEGLLTRLNVSVPARAWTRVEDRLSSYELSAFDDFYLAASVEAPFGDEASAPSLNDRNAFLSDAAFRYDFRDDHARTLTARFMLRLLRGDTTAYRRPFESEGWGALPFALSVEMVYPGSLGFGNVKVYVGRNRLITFLAGALIVQQLINGAPQTLEVGKQFHAFAIEEIERLGGPTGAFLWLKDTYEIDWGALLWEIHAEIKRRDEDSDPVRQPQSSGPK